VKIRIIGSGTCIPSLKRGSSSALLSIDNYNILIDIGPSVVRRLLKFGFEVYDIDIILLTHFHVDHTADLSTFLFACNYGRKERARPLLIIGGRGVTRFYKDLLRLYPWNRPISYRLSINHYHLVQ
jgi:ribonuclease BN (tRNA processing enzyme)